MEEFKQQTIEGLDLLEVGQKRTYLGDRKEQAMEMFNREEITSKEFEDFCSFIAEMVVELQNFISGQTVNEELV